MALDATDRGCFCLACGAFSPDYPPSGACPRCGRPMLKREARKRLELGSAGAEGETTTAAAPPAEVQEASKDPRNVFATKYVLLRRIGSGGMGFVWKAWELPLSRYVAIKFLKAPSPDDIARFEREARLAAALDHPNIIPIYDFGRAEGQFYLTMRYIDGTSLEVAELDERRLIQVLIPVCRAVHSAHEAGVIHRDLKPANVMLSAEGRPMVLDFGLAKTVEGSVDVSVSGMVMGTPSYMAPEQAMGHKDRIDRRSDVYGLGAILYDRVAGRPPFSADAPMEILMKVVNDDLVAPRKHNPRLSAPLETIILKALEKNPADRYSSAAELADDLERLAAGQSIVARPSPRRWIPRVIRRNPLVVAALVLLIIVFSLLARSRSPEAAQVKWREQFLAARTAENWTDLRELMMRADRTLRPEEIEDVLQGFREEAGAIKGSVEKLEVAGPLSWPRMRDDASKLNQRAAAIASVLDGRPLQQQFQALESRAARIAQFPGFVTLRINVHPYAHIVAMTVGGKPVIRGGAVVDPELKIAPEKLISPLALQIVLDDVELELSHPEHGTRKFSVSKSALKEGKEYLICGGMSAGTSLTLEAP